LFVQDSVPVKLAREVTSPASQKLLHPFIAAVRAQKERRQGTLLSLSMPAIVGQADIERETASPNGKISDPPSRTELTERNIGCVVEHKKACPPSISTLSFSEAESFSQTMK